MNSNQNDIKQLWQLYIADQASVSQVQQLFDYIRDNKYDAEQEGVLNEAIELYAMSSVDSADANTSFIHSMDSKRTIISNLLQVYPELESFFTIIASIQQSTASDHGSTASVDQSLASAYQPVSAAHRVSFLKTSWIRYAAAVLLLIGGYGIYKLIVDKALIKTYQPSLAADSGIQPGGNKAILTLADGSTIALSSATMGKLAQQGNAQIIKSAQGEIVYNVKGLPQGAMMMNTMSTPKGGQYQLTLPDGTKVWLNAASAITYPAIFTNADRKVKVSGEVYFEVKKDPAKPFIVDIDGKASVQVLGTSFNIDSYADEGSIRTTLLEGSVKVNNSIVIKPGQQTVQLIDRAEQPKVLNNVDVAKVVAWKNGLFNFNKMPLSVVMKQLERWYDIEVRFEGQLPDLILEGKMDRGVQLKDVLEFFTETGIYSRIEGRKLILSNK